MSSYRQSNPTDFLRLIEGGVSVDRLSSYRRNARSIQEALAYYSWKTALCEALYPSLHAFEIALRNSMHSVLTNQTGSTQWYSATSGILQASELSEISAAKQNLEKLRKPVTPSGIVAEVNFGFWASLLDRRYERILWPQRARSVFPHAPVTELPRERLSSRINRIRRLRNRVFHFEPLWHWDDLTGHHNFVLESIAHINPACRSLAELFDHFEEVHGAGVQPYRDVIDSYIAGLPAS